MVFGFVVLRYVIHFRAVAVFSSVTLPSLFHVCGWWEAGFHCPCYIWWLLHSWILNSCICQNSEACFLCDLLIICTQKSSTQSEVNAQVQVFLSYFGYLLEALFMFFPGYFNCPKVVFIRSLTVFSKGELSNKLA